MNILLTGGTGFLGGHLAAALRDDGHDVALVVRDGSSPKVPIALEDFRCYSPNDAMRGRPFSEFAIDAVIHCATAYGREGVFSSDLVECNVLLPLKLLDLACRGETACFISSDTFFCRQMVEGRAVEDMYMAGYTLSKWQFAQWARLQCAGNDIAYCNMTLHHMYGEYDSPNKFVMWLVRQCLDGVPVIKLRNPGCRRDFVYVRDVVDAYRAVLNGSERMAPGRHEFEVGTGSPLEVCAFAEMAAGELSPGTRVCADVNVGSSGEPESALANLSPLRLLGWEPRFRDHRANLVKIASVLERTRECAASRFETRGTSKGEARG